MKSKNILFGILLIALGLVFALNALGITDIDVFFDGWWTLFIIVPCGVGLLSGRDKTGNLIGLIVGVALLLSCQGILSLGLLWKLFFPALLVIAGCRLIFGSGRADREARRYIEDHKSGAAAQEYCATFSGQDLNFRGQQFSGTKLTAVFGGIKCDLTDAVLDHDAVIEASAIFGGVDIIVPEHCRVRYCSNSVFGGVSEERPHSQDEGAPTVYVNGNCMFGGVSIL